MFLFEPYCRVVVLFINTFSVAVTDIGVSPNNPIGVAGESNLILIGTATLSHLEFFLILGVDPCRHEVF